jgi:hypothetical protein
VAKRLKALLETMPKEEGDDGQDVDDTVDYADEPVPKQQDSDDGEEEDEETIETTRFVCCRILLSHGRVRLPLPLLLPG